MKLIGLILSTLLVMIQYPLWVGSGSWFRVWEMDRLVTEQHARNGGLRLRNEGLEAEVQDLHKGRLAIEERARYALGMIRQDEIFVQLGPLPTGSEPARQAADRRNGGDGPRPASAERSPTSAERGIVAVSGRSQGSRIGY